MPLVALSLLLALQGSATTAPAAPKPDAGPKVTITDLAPGTGDETVRVGDLVEVNYIGKLATGKEFQRNTTPFLAQVGLGKVIRGWDRGILGMKAGGKRRLQIPSALGYGAQGAGKDIPPNADLDFEIELLKIHRAKIEPVKAGVGEALTPAELPTFHYVLTLANGKKVDSSRDRNAPVTVPVQGLIPGFVQGLVGMKPGEIRRVTVAPILGYGGQEIPPADTKDESGKTIAKGSIIPANATLVFEIELVSAEKPKS